MREKPTAGRRPAQAETWIGTLRRGVPVAVRGRAAAVFEPGEVEALRYGRARRRGPGPRPVVGVVVRIGGRRVTFDARGRCGTLRLHPGEVLERLAVARG